jgi:organic hydroperoxide reductase OsmC/OhrA
MPEHLQSVLFSAPAVAEGGREGQGRSLDGRLIADLSVPESMGGSPEPGTNPEELFAAGYTACCLYSYATPGNIDVELSVGGVLLPSRHSGPAAGRGEPA